MAEPKPYAAHTPFYDPAAIAGRDLPIEANPISPIDLAMALVPGSPLARAMGMAARSAPAELSLLSRAAIGGGRAAATAGLANDLASGHNPGAAMPLNYGAGFALGLGGGMAGGMPLWTRTEPLQAPQMMSDDIAAALASARQQAAVSGRMSFPGLPSGPGAPAALPGPPRPSGLLEVLASRSELPGARPGRVPPPQAVIPPGGPFFHGSRNMFNLNEGPWGLNYKNLYGSGLYTTNDPRIARGYAGDMMPLDLTALEKRSPGVYAVFEQSPQQMYDLEAPANENGPLANAFRNYLNNDPNIENEYSDWFNDSVNKLASGRAVRTLEPPNWNDKFEPTEASIYRLAKKALWDRAVDNSGPFGSMEDGGAEDIELMMENIANEMQGLGYGGFSHIGGKLAGGGQRLHNVRIYFDPNNQVFLTPYWARASAPKPSMVGQRDFSRFSNAGRINPDLAIEDYIRSLAEEFYNSGRNRGR